MTGVQRLVDEVRAQLSAHDQTISDGIRLLADEYATACTQTEARLRRCEELTRSGHRGEAIHLAELDPPLLEVVSILSFPERTMWAEVACLYNLPAPPPISVDRAKEFNKAYADYNAVGPLVTRLRHLGRARAPIGERAAALRELCARDPNCPLWPDQLVALEGELRGELAKALEADLRAGDRARMHEYYTALTAPGWRKPAPPALVARAAAECLPRVLAQLSMAVGRDDLPAARQTRAEWDRIARDARLDPTNPLADRAAGLLARVDRLERRAEQHDKWEAALETLREALQRGAPVEELTEVYDRMRETGAKAPRALIDQYQARVSRDERRRDNRQTIWGVVAMVAGAVVLVTFLVFILRR